MDEDASYITLFVEEQRRLGKTPGTIRVRNGHLITVLSAFGTFDSVTRRTLDKWFAKQGYTDGTKTAYVDTLSEFFKYGRHCHWFDEDPTAGMIFVSAGMERQASTDTDVAKALSTATKPILRCWLGLMAYQGLRPQQIADLKREDLDLDADPSVLSVNSTVLHPKVLVEIDVMDLPRTGRLFPDYTAANIGKTVSRHLEANGIVGTSTSLVMWHRLQVENRGKNFDRAQVSDVGQFLDGLAFEADTTTRIRRQFQQRDYESAVFLAMKAVEVRVRTLAGLGDEATGVALMTRAFKPDGGLLTDVSAVPGEQLGTMDMFKGSYAVLRNPSGHRDVDYSNATEAMEVVGVASVLMRILNRVEERLSDDQP